MPLGSARHYQESSVHLFTALKKESSQTSTLHDNAFKIKYSSSWRNLLWLFFMLIMNLYSRVLLLLLLLLFSVFSVFLNIFATFGLPYRSNDWWFLLYLS